MRRRRDTYELRIARLNGRALHHDPGAVSEVFDPDDQHEFEAVCRRHFVPLACAAERTPVRDRVKDMPFLDDYTLEVRRRGQGIRIPPVAQFRSPHQWRHSRHHR